MSPSEDSSCSCIARVSLRKPKMERKPLRGRYETSARYSVSGFAWVNEIQETSAIGREGENPDYRHLRHRSSSRSEGLELRIPFAQPVISLERAIMRGLGKKELVSRDLLVKPICGQCPIVA